jgi:hypothetical protein
VDAPPQVVGTGVVGRHEPGQHGRVILVSQVFFGGQRDTLSFRHFRAFWLATAIAARSVILKFIVAPAVEDTTHQRWT